MRPQQAREHDLRQIGERCTGDPHRKGRYRHPARSVPFASTSLQELQDLISTFAQSQRRGDALQTLGPGVGGKTHVGVPYEYSSVFVT